MAVNNGHYATEPLTRAQLKPPTCAKEQTMEIATRLSSLAIDWSQCHQPVIGQLTVICTRGAQNVLVDEEVQLCWIKIQYLLIITQSVLL